MLETYESLKQAANHYKHETNYCGVIATAIALNMKFGKARRLLHKLGRQDGKSTLLDMLDVVFKARNKGFKPHTITSNFALKNATHYLPKTGTFLLWSERHITCVRDGINEDWSTDSFKRVKGVVQVVDAEQAFESSIVYQMLMSKNK